MSVQGCNDPAKHRFKGRVFEERGSNVSIVTDTKESWYNAAVGGHVNIYQINDKLCIGVCSKGNR